MKKGKHNKDDLKSETFKFRISKKDKERLFDCSNYLGCSASEVILKGIDYIYTNIK